MESNSESDGGADDDVEVRPSSSNFNEAVAVIKEKVKENLQQAQHRQKRNYDKRVTPSEVHLKKKANLQ